jgi:DNA-binding beta-propeller fold protein YncE
VLAVAAVSVGLAAPTGTAQTPLAPPVRIVGGAGHAFLYGWGVAASPNGRTMYVSDYWNFEVKRFALDGTYLGPIARTTRGNGPGQHLSPYDVATAPGGDLYFGDVDANRTVDRYTAAGDFVLEFGGRGTGPGLYEYPSYVDVASDRRVFVVDSRQHHVTVNTPDGVEVFRFGGSGVERGMFRTPRGIAICRGCAVVREKRADLVFVVDTRNARVQVFSYVPGAARVVFERAFGCSGARARCRFAPGLNLRGIAVDADRRRVYVVDAAGDDVDAFRFSGRPLFSFGGEGGGEGRFTDGGRDVDVDRRGRIWVGDLANFRAQVFSREGRFLFEVPRDPAPPPLDGFNGPSDVAVSTSGVAYVVDTRNQRVVKWDVAGAASPVTAWGSRGKGSFGFNYPRAVAVDDSGRACPTPHCVYVADTDNARIRKYTSTGKFLWRVGGGDTSEGSMKSWSLDVGPDGNLYVANGGRRKVSIVSPDGEVLREFGRPLPATGTPQPSQFGFPRGIDVAPDGTIWVADGERGDVQHFDEDGTYLGRIAPSGAGEDVLLLASDVKVDAGLVYVADTRANRIKVWTTSGDFVGSFGGGGSNLGRMFGPLGMDLVGDRLWVTESTGERVQEFRLND